MPRREGPTDTQLARKALTLHLGRVGASEFAVFEQAFSTLIQDWEQEQREKERQGQPIRIDPVTNYMILNHPEKRDALGLIQAMLYVAKLKNSMDRHEQATANELFKGVAEKFRAYFQRYPNTNSQSFAVMMKDLLADEKLNIPSNPLPNLSEEPLDLQNSEPLLTIKSMPNATLRETAAACWNTRERQILNVFNVLQQGLAPKHSR